jgi:hypothetical protein
MSAIASIAKNDVVWRRAQSTKAFARWLKFIKAVMREFILQSFADGRADYFKNRVRRIG